MKGLAYGLAALLGLLGLIFIAGHQGQLLRILVGVVLIGAAITLVAAVRLRPQVEQRTFVQKLHLTGDVSLEEMKCRQCAGQLSGDSVQVRAGAVFIACPYCGSSYQIEESAKW